MKVVILGSGQMLTNLIAGCMDTGCSIAGVFRYETVRFPFLDRVLIDIFNPSKEYNYIKSHKLQDIKAKSANSAEFKKEMLKLNPDLIIVGTWGEKIKKPIFTLPKLATINVHPALLPKYRGPNPYYQAIKNMETQSGVTFHLMEEDFDSGPILSQKTVDIVSTDTGVELRNKITLVAREGVCELIKTLDKEIIIPVKQDEQKASYFPQISKEDVMLDFTKSAAEVSAHIRGLHPWSKCYYEYKNKFFIPNPYKLKIIEANDLKRVELPEHIHSGTAVEKSGKERSITVLCGDGKLLKMDEVRLYGPLRSLTGFYIDHFVELNS